MAGIFNKISIEPVILLYSVTNFLSSSLSTALLRYKTCDPTYSTKAVLECDHISIASIDNWKILVQQAVSIVVAMIAGTWSDRHGRRRKPLIMWPIAGQILADVLSLCCAYNRSVSAQMTAAVQAVAIGCTGAIQTFLVGVNAYVGDTTTEKDRTIKYAMVNAFGVCGNFMGMGVFERFTFTSVKPAYMATVVFGLITLTMSYESLKNNIVHDGNDTAAAVTVAEPLSFCQDVLHTANPINVFRSYYHLLTKQRDHNKSIILWLVVLICVPLTCLPKLGETTVLPDFLKNRFQWTEEDLEIFYSEEMIFIFIGTLFFLYVLSHRLQMDDAIIGTIATVSDFASPIVFLVAYQWWHPYLVPPFDIFIRAAYTLTSSIASKCVGVDELGAMNSFKLLMEELIINIFIPSYSFVYNLTLKSMPNAFFLISVILITPRFFVFLFIYHLTRRSI